MDFSKRYNREEFVKFLQNDFLPEDDFLTETTEAKIQQETQYIKTITKLGASPSLRLAVYEARHTSTHDARVGLSKEIFRFMANKRERKALVAFVPEGNDANYRLSLISIDLVENEDGNVKRTYSNPRRYSYYLGEGIACRTPRDFLQKAGRVKNVEDLAERFSVEPISKEFFNKYREHYADIVCYITGKRYVKEKGKWVEKMIHEPCREIFNQFATVYDNPEKTVRDYIKKLLGRLVFLQFLQKKGWLGVPADREDWIGGDKRFLQNKFNEFEDKDNFIDGFLEPLFNDLNTDRKEQGDRACEAVGSDIKVPFLNGGLFQLDEEDCTDIRLPKEYMGGLFDFFEQYNFTIDENDPNDAQVGVDPEMLGRVFENLLEDNKDKGAFYTPKEIVQYMCRESLIAYLQTGIADDTEKEIVRQFVLTHDAAPLGAMAEDISISLLNVKICDPAIGSGAFPMGLLRELYLCQCAIHPKLEEKGAADIKRHIIQNNIYGVDIEKGAVDIARLRFWLSLIVDEETPKFLPNLDFKIMQGNSLLEQYKGVDLSKMTERKTENQGNIQLMMFDDTLDLLRLDLRKKLNEYYSCSDHKRKEVLKQEIIDNVKEQLKVQSINVDFGDIDLSANDQFTLWHTWFYDVFSQGGFDIIIGNPPYQRIQGIRNTDSVFADELVRQYKSAVGSFDLYAIFTEQGLRLISKDGLLNYIMPVKWTNAAFGKGLRGIVSETHSASKIINFGAYQVFNASTYTGLQWFKPNCNELIYHELDRNLNTNHELACYLGGLTNTRASRIKTDKLNKEAWVLTKGLTTQILNKLEQSPRRIKDVFDKIFQGLATSKDDVYFLYDCKDNGECIIGYSKQTGCRVTIERGLVKPLLKGDDVHRYDNITTNRCVIFPYKIVSGKAVLYTEQELAALYPQGYAYLKECENVLRGREKGRLINDDYWFRYIYPKNLVLFDKEKLVAPDISLGGNFAYDAKGEFYSTTTIYGYIKKEGIKESYKFWLALLNSNLFWWFLTNTGTTLANGFFRFKPDYIRPFPVPESIPSEAEKAIEGLIDKINSLKSANPNADILEYEKQIDCIIYKLYSLDNNEIKIIEQYSNNSESL